MAPSMNATIHVPYFAFLNDDDDDDDGGGGVKR